MKNNKDASFTPWAMKKIDICDKQPCWYVKIENEGDREDAKWTVGVKEDGEKPVELEVEAVRLGDVSNDEFWNHFVSYEFALTLLDTFRNGKIKDMMGVK